MISLSNDFYKNIKGYENCLIKGVALQFLFKLCLLASVCISFKIKGQRSVGIIQKGSDVVYFMLSLGSRVGDLGGV